MGTTVVPNNLTKANTLFITFIISIKNSFNIKCLLLPWLPNSRIQADYMILKPWEAQLSKIIFPKQYIIYYLLYWDQNGFFSYFLLLPWLPNSNN